MTLQSQLQHHGIALISELIAADRIATLVAFFEQGEIDRSTRDGATFGARNLLGLGPVQAIATSPEIAACLTPLLGSDFLAVRGLFFDKTQEANWPVAWHQDLSVAVMPKQEIAGWTNWSIKRGVPHAQPPASLLERMVTLRLHLDDCDSENGPLRVVAGSHAKGTLARDAITALAAEATVITAKAGDAILMRPLVLHASSPARLPRHRRVLHLEFAPAGLLPPGLNWAMV